MDTMREEVQCRPGDEVFGSDDKKIGKIVAVDARYLTVEHGLLSKSEYFIPMSAVNACNAGRVYLNVTKDAAAGAAWDVPPVMATEAGDLPMTH